MAGLKVGALAKRAGVTVRTLHHYHRIGLVVPTARTGAGHRLYGERDIRRLTQVMLLRGLGMQLHDIARALRARANAAAMETLLQRHIDLLRERIQAEGQLCRRMESLMHVLQSRRV